MNILYAGSECPCDNGDLKPHLPSCIYYERDLSLNAVQARREARLMLAEVLYNKDKQGNTLGLPDWKDLPEAIRVRYINEAIRTMRNE